MPRKARIDAPGALHHVIIRGIEKRKIFRSDDDRLNFVKRLAELISEEVLAFGKSRRTVKARALLCYWAHRKLGMTATEIAKRLKMGQPAVSRLSKRGEHIEKEWEVHLIRR